MAVLDPRISYEGLKGDFAHDKDLLDHLKSAKSALQGHFDTHYAGRTVAPIVHQPIASSTNPFASPQKNFFARYEVQTRDVVDELRDYYSLSREDFATCDPVQWWFARKAHFPNLFCLARDLMTIPGEPFYFIHLLVLTFTFVGSAVAVERIFSGGRDTISLRRASLKPETIRTLMLVKQRLRLARTAVKEILG